MSAGPGAAGEGPHEDRVGDARPGDEGHRGRRPTLIRLCQAPGQQGQEKVRRKSYVLLVRTFPANSEGILHYLNAPQARCMTQHLSCWPRSRSGNINCPAEMSGEQKRAVDVNPSVALLASFAGKTS